MDGYRSEHVIETEGLTKVYGGKRAVDSVEMHVKRGDVYGLIGRNGAGKTTLMKLILGLARPVEGKIRLFGSENVNEGRKRIGSLIESPGLYKSCSAYENMKRFSYLYGADEKKIAGLLDFVGLGNVGKKKAGQFSLGMKQRLGIAIALIGEPDVLILDEPINGLDPTGIMEIRNLFTELANKGVTLVISSHILGELEKVVSVYGIIKDGKLVEEITVDELESHCAKFIKLKTNDNASALSILEKEGFTCEIKGDALQVFTDAENSGRINSELVKSGIEISEIERVNEDIEKYFIEKMGNE